MPGFLGQIFGGGGLQSVLGGLGGLFGGIANQRELNQTRDDIRSNTNFRDQSFGGPGGSAFIGAGGENQFQQDALSQLFGGALGGQGLSLLGGGLFNDPQLQAALQGNDISGALGQANNALGQQAGNTAFGGLGGLFNQASGLGSQFATNVAAGPQDFTGGLQSSLFNRGAANQLAAGDQSALFNQSLASQRAAAQPAQDRLFNRLQDRQFAQGRLGSSGGAGETQAFFDSLGQQDLGFQNNAFQQANTQANFLANLGNAQIGQGAGLLGQNLGQFNQNANFANQFGQLAQGLEGQQFQQALQALNQNQSAGLQRLQAAQGLFGLGTETFGQQFGLGLGAFEGVQDQNRFGLETLLGLRGAENNRISATGQGSRALAEVQGNSGGGIGGFISGLFSDARLKENVTRIGTLGNVGWYEWDWNDKAKAVGADSQPSFGVIAQEIEKEVPEAVSMDETGYLKVDYRQIVGV